MAVRPEVVAAHETDAVTLAPCVSLSLHFRLIVPQDAAAECSALYEACRADAAAPVIEDLDLRALFGPDRAQAMLDATGAVDGAAIDRSRDAMVILHASGVVSPTGPVLFVGPSGAGKSSLSAALTASGWTYAGDEAMGLDRSGEGLVANPKPWKLDDAARAALESFGVEPPAEPRAGTGETLLAPRAVGDCLQPGPMPAPVAVVRVDFCAGAQVAVEPLARADVAELLVTQSFNFAHLGGSALDAVAHVGRTVPGVHLRFGRLGDAADAIRDLVA